MSYRHRAARRREVKSRRLADKIRSNLLPPIAQRALVDKTEAYGRRYAAAHPVIRYEPARPPVENWLGDKRGDGFQFTYNRSLEACPHCDESTKPLHRVVQVPIAHRMNPRLLELDTRPDTQLWTVLFQATQFALDVTEPWGTTRIGWWGWQPVEEALRPEVRSGLRRAAAFAERAWGAMEQVFGIRRTDTPTDDAFRRLQTYGRWGMYELAEWLKVVIEDVEQNLGKP